MKYHRMTEQAESLTTVFMQIPFWSRTPIILHTSNLEADGTISSRMVRTNSSVTRCHIPQEQNPQLHYCQNVNTHQLQSICTILQTNVLQSQRLVFNSLIIFLHTPSTTQENYMTHEDGEYI